MVTATDTTVGMIAEVVNIKGHNGDEVNAYVARPTGNGPFPGVVLIHHAPGWDEWYWEATRKFAQHGYAAICPNLYSRFGHGTPEDVAATVRGAGGAPDETVIGDLEGAIDWLKGQSYSNGKAAVFGTCSGGRQAFLAAARLGNKIDAVVECWGGGVVQDELTPARPVAPITLTNDVTAPVLGIFGNEDRSPTPEQVNQHEEELKKAGKDYEFHRFDGAGHGFFYHDRPAYRQEQAVEGWKKIWEFLPKHLS
jgi:carboxymethylenebutenolidase